MYFLKNLTAINIGTKNVPDAIEWHFAKYWMHIFKKFNMRKQKLEKMLLPSSNLLETSIAIPISSKKNDKKTKKIAFKIFKIAKKLKLN